MAGQFAEGGADALQLRRRVSVIWAITTRAATRAAPTHTAALAADRSAWNVLGDGARDVLRENRSRGNTQRGASVRVIARAEKPALRRAASRGTCGRAVAAP